MPNTPPIGIPGTSTASRTPPSDSHASTSTPIPIKYPVAGTSPNPYSNRHPADVSNRHSNNATGSQKDVKPDSSPTHQRLLRSSMVSKASSGDSPRSQPGMKKKVDFAGESPKASSKYRPDNLEKLKGEPKDRTSTHDDLLPLPPLSTTMPRFKLPLDDSRAMTRIYQQVGARIMNMKQLLNWEEATNPFGKAAHKMQRIVGLRSPQDRMTAFLNGLITHPSLVIEWDPFVTTYDMYTVRFKGEQQRPAFLSVGKDANGHIAINTTRFDIQTEVFDKVRLRDFEQRLYTWQMKGWTIRYSATEKTMFSHDDKIVVLDVRRGDNASVIRAALGDHITREIAKQIQQEQEEAEYDAQWGNPPDADPADL